MDWNDVYASRMELLQISSSIGNILQLAEQPEVISLAGGLPDPKSFPLERIRESTERVLRDEPEVALNYGPGPGFSKLRHWIVERMAACDGIFLEPENTLVCSGGVEGLHLVSMAMLDKGDTIVVEAPTYMIALHLFREYQVEFAPVEMDEQGTSPEALREVFKHLKSKGIKPKFFYTIPSFQNPSGRSMSEIRRRQVVTVCEEANVPILEDNAYADLVYDGDKLPSLKSIAPNSVIFVHTFSKIFGPGVRLGWIAAGKEMVQNLSLCKLCTDQCANTFTQRIVYDYGKHGYIDDQVAGSIKLYRRKRDLMEKALSDHLPEGASWVHPAGGFFLWVTLPAGADTESLLLHAIKKEKTAFVAGPPFFVDGRGKESFRLSFSYVDETRIDEAIQRIARAIIAMKFSNNMLQTRD